MDPSDILKAHLKPLSPEDMAAAEAHQARLLTQLAQEGVSSFLQEIDPSKKTVMLPPEARATRRLRHAVMLLMMAAGEMPNDFTVQMRSEELANNFSKHEHMLRAFCDHRRPEDIATELNTVLRVMKQMDDTPTMPLEEGLDWIRKSITSRWQQTTNQPDTETGRQP